MKKVIKIDVAYIEAMIGHLRLLNTADDELTRSLFGLDKIVAIENVLAGIERTVNMAKKVKQKKP